MPIIATIIGVKFSIKLTVTDGSRDKPKNCAPCVKV